MRVILGINAYHADAAAALLIDGRLVVAVEEERFRRIKHWAGFPSHAIRCCLEATGIPLERVDVVAINTDPRANMGAKIMFALKSVTHPGFLRHRLQSARKRFSIRDELHPLCSPGFRFFGDIVRIEHHQAHLASAFLASPFDRAVTLSIDGFGDFRSSAWGMGVDKRFSLDGGINFPHSLGLFYQALTQYLGFLNYGDEYKVMGLAPYGALKYMDEMEKMVRLGDRGCFSLDLDYFMHHKHQSVSHWEGGLPELAPLFNKENMTRLLGKPRFPGEPLLQRHKDIAHSVQAMYEKALFHLLGYLHEIYNEKSLTLAGGCAMNSVANGKILANTPFKHLYVQAAAGDAGGAVGAAMMVWMRQQTGPTLELTMRHAYWGPAFSNEKIGEWIHQQSDDLEKSGCLVLRMENDAAVIDWTVEQIQGGKVVGWFQGAMEWGPRALGNRSILGDPRRADMREILNSKIKRRESFRPFASSILRARVGEWFDADVDCPFMTQVFPVRQEKRTLIPAVTHVDGSGRLQTVTEEQNPLFFRLIEHFYHRTGVPLLLNTSFNENEPVVCHPREALACFLRTEMDCLIAGHWIVYRGAYVFQKK
ncbi:MAG: Carbamoyltransferase [Magnetococcales bacterium]|nr:Carbamoyltransferase [Magnetococcales bacterium]